MEQRIDIEFTVFILRLHQERLIELLQLVSEFQGKLERVLAKHEVTDSNKDRIGDAGPAPGGSAVQAIGAVLATIAEEGAEADVPVKGEWLQR